MTFVSVIKKKFKKHTLKFDRSTYRRKVRSKSHLELRCRPWYLATSPHQIMVWHENSSLQWIHVALLIPYPADPISWQLSCETCQIATPSRQIVIFTEGFELDPNRPGKWSGFHFRQSLRSYIPDTPGWRVPGAVTLWSKARPQYGGQH